MNCISEMKPLPGRPTACPEPRTALSSLLPRVTILALLLTTTLAGCVVGPDYQAPRTALPQFYRNKPALEASRSRNQAPPLDRWWTGFRDPELVRIIDRVLAQNLDLAAALAQVRQARAVAKWAGARELPQGSLDASVAREHQSLESPLGKIASAFPGYRRDQTLEGLSLGAAWELDLAGGLKRKEEVARYEAEAAEATRAGIRISIAAEAADAYFRVRGAQERIALIERQVAAHAELLELERRQVSYGVATKRNLAQAEATLAGVRATLAPLRVELELQSNRLAVLMGKAPGACEAELKQAQDGYVYAVPSIDAGEGPGELLRRRPDVIAAERRLAASNARIGAAVAEYYPKLSLSALLGFESLASGTMFTSSSFQPAAMAGLHWRLFDFGLVDAEVARAEGGEAEALAHYRLAMLRATEEVEDTVMTFAQIGRQRQELDIEEKNREQARRSVWEEYRAGAASRGEVLAEECPMLAAREERARLEADEARASVAVFRALGGGWTPGGLSVKKEGILK